MHALPAPGGPRRALPGRVLALLTILTVASGCDKARALAGAGGADAAEPPPSERLDLSKRPEILFQIFGERDDARMIPIAVIEGGRLNQIVLASEGWRQFDALYGKSGTSYKLYRDGRSVGTATIRQGMWERPEEPLYSLPNCSLLIPLSRVRLDTRMRMGFTVEALASNATLGRAGGAASPMPQAEVDRVAREVGEVAAQRARIASGTLAGLTLNAVAIQTRSVGSPAIIVTFTDPRAEELEVSGGKTASIFAIAEEGEDGTYQIAFSHIVNGSADDAEYRRFLDHLDIDADGTDEIVLEGWDTQGASFLSVLQSAGGSWKEIYRSRGQWCLDRG